MPGLVVIEEGHVNSFDAWIGNVGEEGALEGGRFDHCWVHFDGGDEVGDPLTFGPVDVTVRHYDD